MKTVTLLLLFFAIPAVTFCGCTLFQGGPSVIKWEPGEAPRLGKAPRDGIYALYDSSDLDAKASASLKQGEDIGFKEIDGTLMAVAGTESFPISDLTTRHYWRFKTP